VKSLVAMALVATAMLTTAAWAQTEPAQSTPGKAGEWISLMDGKTFDGWKSSEENSDTWQLKDGAFLAAGPRSHLFYVGPEQPFTNFELEADVRTTPKSNGGIYIHTTYQASGWPKDGYEIQVNQSHSDWRKSGSIYAVNDVKTTHVKDNEWHKYNIKVQGKRITVKLNDEVVNDWTEEADRKPGTDFTRILSKGTFGLQAHDPESRVEYKNIRVRKLE
jgi:hypothetical protein